MTEDHEKVKIPLVNLLLVVIGKSGSKWWGISRAK